MNKDTILSGIHIGEHSFDPDAVIEEIQTRCIDKKMNFVTIRPPMEESVPQEYFIKWAKFLAENKIYFVFLFAVQHPPKDADCHLTKETIAEIKRIAGNYFIGDMLGETGSSFACKFPGYYNMGLGKGKDDFIPDCNIPDMEVAHLKYIDYVSKFIEVGKQLEMPEIISTEATNLNKYNLEAGTTIPALELMCGNPEILVSSTRGLARVYDSIMWGTYIAHEWYGGMRHDDALKKKRLELAYKYAYLAGSQMFCLESGDEAIDSYGYQYDSNSPVCQDYQRVLAEFTEFLHKDERPSGGPKTKIAFVQGNHDAWGGWGGSSLWNQFQRPEWGHNEAEYSWRLLEEIGKKRDWNDIANFGERDLSALPAYGMYDIIPAEAPKEKLRQYDYLIFVGWNSMTDEIYENLLDYVTNGGKLLMTAAHLNYNVARNSKLMLLDNQRLERLFGCHFDAEAALTNAGVKFALNSHANLNYPGTKDKVCDPIYSSGYISYIKCNLTRGYPVAELSQSFLNEQEGLPYIIENKVGRGIATLVCSANYPGNPALYPLYRTIVREIITQSARNADIRVTSNGALRYAVYDTGKIYLLNTDYDFPIDVLIETKSGTHRESLAPLELKSVIL
ncbi:MAG: hypothetical protein IJB80_01290 [Clostridia bacterium]|nr:hypothetical protein [Clostridia bacterium]